MKPYLYGLALGVMAGALCTGCRATRVATHTIENDSVRVEIIERIKYVVDTVEVAVPYYHEQRETRDTMSFLENPFALSSAAISGGTLYHSLQTIPRTWRVQIKKPILRRDSLVYRNFHSTNTVEVPAELTKMQRFAITGFWSIVGAAGLLLAYQLLKLWRRIKPF